MRERTHSPHFDTFVPGRVVLDELDLRVALRFMKMPWTRYTGTRRAIQETGLVPTTVQWVDGYAKYDWTGEDGLRYRLTRIRPDGVKGPRRAFLLVDHWELLVQTPYDQYDADEVQVKERELAALKHRRSPEGRAAWNKEYDRCLVAKADHAFQTMLASILPNDGGRHDA